MTALRDEQRRRLWAHLMRTWNVSLLGPLPSTKPELRTVVDNTDNWIDGNATSYNSALPQPFRGSATPEAKTYVFCLVAMARAGLLRTDEDLA